MDIKQKRAYLKSYQSLQNRIVGLTNELEKWKTLGEKVNNAMGTGGGSGNPSSKVEKSAVNATDILKKIQVEINTAEDQRQTVLDAISKGKKLRQREILRMHFVNGMSVAKIARRLGKEEKTVSNAITNALRDLDI